MAVDKGVVALQKILDSRSFDPQMFVWEFLLTSDVGAKLSFMDIINSAIVQAPILLARATERGDSDRAINVYRTLILMGEALDGPPVDDNDDHPVE